MAELPIRVLSPDELIDLVRLEALVWGWPVDESKVEWYTEFLDPGHTIGAYDGDRLVAVHGMTRLQLTVPGGAVLELGGVTVLSVHPLYRRCGLMSRLTAMSLDLIRRDGYPLAAGMPHHSWTHERYGYGVATRYANVELELTGERTLRGVCDDGRLEYASCADALPLLHELSLRLCGRVNGWVPRAAASNVYKYGLAGETAGEYGPTVFAVHRSAGGEVDGFLAYRRTMAGCDSRGRPTDTLRVQELFGVDAAVEAQLWLHCLSDPMITRITGTRRPVHDPVAARLPEPRAWHAIVRDDMIVRLLDIPRVLAARRFSREDAVTIEVPGAGRYTVSGGLDTASCVPSDAPPDLTLPAPALAAAYLGDTSIVDLAATDDIVEHTPGSLRRATAMFTWSPAPRVQDSF